MRGYDLQKARSNFSLDSSIIYLNHASHSPLPIRSRRAYELYLDSWQMTSHDHDAESFEIIEEVRRKLASMIGASPERVGLSNNTTFGLNIIAAGYQWESGDNVVISECEFPANVYPWMRLESRGVEIRFAKTDRGFIDEDAIIQLCDKNTRVISVSWVQYNNGYRVDLGELGRFCRDNGIIFCVDGIQGMGVIPIDVPSLDIDLFSCGCQKWMLGPYGTGFFYLSERAEKKIETPFCGWLSVEWGADFSNLMRYRLPLRKGPSKYESGIYPYQDIRALNASLDFLASFDRLAAWEHIKSLTDILIGRINADNRYELISSCDDIRRSGIVTFSADDSLKLYSYLKNRGFIISFREGGVRVSPHFYNNEDEINALSKAIENFEN